MLNELLEKYNYSTIDSESAALILKQIKLFFSEKKIVVWGAGITGRFYNSLFFSLGLKVSYFIDKNAQVLKGVEGVNVLTKDKLEKEQGEVIVIAAGNPSIVNSIMAEASNLKLEKNIVIVPGDGLVSIFKCSDCMIKVDSKKELNLAECSICNNLESECASFKKATNLDKINTNNSKPSFGMIGYILGQVCTLNCKHCCESVPYIEKPIMVKTDQVIADIKKIANSCSYISRLEFIGGEPFLHNGLPTILKAVLETNNIGYALVFTNATVMPNEELIQILKHPRVVLNFSGYKDTLSVEQKQKGTQVKDRLIQEGVKFAFYNPDSRNWLDINHYEKREIEDSLLKEYHQKCFMYVCHRLFNGAFYGCPHQYSGIQLGKIEKYPYEYIEMHQHSELELTELLKKFKSLDFTEACRFCNLPYDADVVPPAIQLEN